MLRTKKPLKAKSTLKAKAVLKASKTPKKQKKPTVSKLKKQLDAVFSKYIRLRDKSICITCGGEGNQAGHFQSRRYNSTRFHEQNVNAQCYRDNVLFYGEQYKYAVEVDLKYGAGTASKLSSLAKQPHQFTVPELQELLTYYEKEVLWYENQTK